MTDTVRASSDDNFTENEEEAARFAGLSKRERGILLGSIVAVALCGIVYELIIAAVSSYLLGSSVTQFSLTIGFFMCAMGIGSYLSQFIRRRLIHNFILIEIILAFIGAICSVTLFFGYSFSPYFYRTLMLGFILSIGTLVGLEIPLLTRILAELSGTRKSIANVMSLDYAGALAGSVLFPLFLLPSLGLVRVSFAIGLINIGVALATAVFLRKQLGTARGLITLALGGTLAIFLMLLASARLTALAQQHLFFDQIVWQKQSQYQNLAMTTDWSKNDLRLFIDNHLQFSESDEHRYHEALVHALMGYAGSKENVLVLGGGDGLAARELLKYDEVARIDLVDLDPAITDLARDFPPLKSLNNDSFASSKVTVINADAFTFINKDGLLYDRVIIDMPDPHSEVISKLYSLEFYTMIRNRMAPDAIVITQSSSPYFARRTYWSVGETLGAAFPETQAFHTAIPSFGIWGFHMAANKKGRFDTAYNVDVATRYWTAEVFAAAKIFGKDITPLGGEIVNTIFEPKLYIKYTEDMRKPVF